MKQLILFCLTLLSLSVQAQFKWSFEDRNFVLGDTVPMRVYVSGFDSVGAFQYSFAYDTNNLSIRLDTPFTFTGLLSSYDASYFSHGLQPGCLSAKNEIRTLWADPYIHSYPNGHVYTVWFIAKQAGTTCGSIEILDGPMPIEAWNENLITPVEMIVGCISARRPKRVDHPIREREELSVRVYPNPAADYIYVDSTEPAQVTVYNSLGELTFFNKIFSSTEPIFVEKGISVVKIVTKEKTILKQVFRY